MGKPIQQAKKKVQQAVAVIAPVVESAARKTRDTAIEIGEGAAQQFRDIHVGVGQGLLDTSNDLIGKPTVNFGRKIGSTLEDTASVLRDINDPTHPIGASASLAADQADIDALNRNNKIIADATKPASTSNPSISGQTTTNTPSSISKDIPKGEEDVGRKIKGRAATLLTGPSGLMDVPFTARRKLLGA